MNKVISILKKVFSPVKLIYKELKLVEWLSLRQTMQSTLLVLALSLVIGIIIAGLDTVFFFGRDLITSF